MNWALIAQLIVSVGIPTAEKLIALWMSNAPVTGEAFQEVRAIALQTAQDRMRAALVKAGVPLDSEQAKTLLALTV